MSMKAIFAVMNTTEYHSDRRRDLYCHKDKNPLTCLKLSDLGMQQVLSGLAE